jgi:uncharacterized protein YciI
MNYYALFYHYAPDYMERRPHFRSDHLARAQAAHERGELLLGGVLDPPDLALIVFRAADPSVVEEFVRNDPYVLNGLVVRHEIRPWTVVIGSAAP